MPKRFQSTPVQGPQCRHCWLIQDLGKSRQINFLMLQSLCDLTNCARLDLSYLLWTSPWRCIPCSQSKEAVLHRCFSCTSDPSRLSIEQVQSVPLFWCWGFRHSTAPWSLIHSGTDEPSLLLPHTLWSLSIWKKHDNSKMTNLQNTWV